MIMATVIFKGITVEDNKKKALQNKVPISFSHSLLIIQQVHLILPERTLKPTYGQHNAQLP